MEFNLEGLIERLFYLIEEVIKKVDIIVYFVGYKGFKNLKIDVLKMVLDFVGIN